MQEIPLIMITDNRIDIRSDLLIGIARVTSRLLRTLEAKSSSDGADEVDLPAFLSMSIQTVLSCIDRNLNCFSSFLFAPDLHTRQDLILVATTGNKGHLFAEKRYSFESTFIADIINHNSGIVIYDLVDRADFANDKLWNRLLDYNDIGPFPKARILAVPLWNLPVITGQADGILILYIDADAMLITGDNAMPLLLAHELSGFLRLWYLTIDLSEKRSYQLADSLEELRDDKIKEIAHEILGPIQTINIYMKLLRDMFKQDYVFEIVDVIENQIKKIEDRTKNFIELTKIAGGIEEARPVSSHKERHNSEDVFESAINEVRNLAEQKHIIISPQITGIPNLPLDPEHFRDIVLNVLYNAVKYSHSDTTIEINFQIMKRDVFISFINYGIEIQREEREKIFRLGYRSKMARQVEVIASGMGLYITRKILQRYGFDIYVLDSAFTGIVDDGRMFRNIIQMSMSMDLSP